MWRPKLGEVGFQRRFLEIFFALANSKENKKNSFYHIPWFKRLVVLKADKRCHDIRWTGTVRDFCKLWL